MRAPSNLMLALLSLSISSAFAAGTDVAARETGGLRDGSGQPVLDGFGDCWGTGFTGPDAAACANLRSRQMAQPAPVSGASTEQTASTGAGLASEASSGTTASYATPAPEPISAKGNPAYVTDTNGIVVRGSQGECWRTGSWTPAQATVVGCDGVLARAAPVPSPAPSPKPRPASPAQVAPESEAAPPLVAPSETPSEAPPLVAPSETPPAAAAPESRTAPPVVVPPSPPPANAELAPESGAAAQPQSEKITLDTDTYFDFDKSTLKPAGESKLQEIAHRLSSMKLEVVVATGHTDWTGTDAYNQKLSERRANAVKRFLVQQGLPGNRIFTEGKGEKQPVASNHTREGRAQNRRVVVEVVGKRNR